jgi:hypothetical protein
VTPRLRVEALLVAARRTFGPGRDAALVDALAAESGLHVENVAWALEHALELHPSEAELTQLFARARTRSAVVVVLAANVFVAPLRAVAWALAQGERVLVRASRRAPTFARALVESAPEGLSLEWLEPTDAPAADVANALARLPANAAVHAYGGREALAGVARAAARASVAAELHGPGFGAVIDAEDALIGRVEDVARDIVAFDQSGCLSPRIVVVLGEPEPVARALHHALERLGHAVPRRALEASERAELRRALDAAHYAGHVWEGGEHAVVVSPRPSLLPALRVVTVCGARHSDDAIALVAGLGPELSNVGTSSPNVAAAFAHVRVSPLGAMQSPPLDGPVDRRVG